MRSLRISVILLAFALALTPGAMGVISYQGSHVETQGGMAKAESNALSQQAGAIQFEPTTQAFVAGIPASPDPLIVDPWAAAWGAPAYAGYAHTYVYAGVNAPAGTSGYAETKGNWVANARQVLGTSDEIKMQASATGTATAQVTTAKTPTVAESLISGWAAYDGARPDIRGHAQITSRVNIGGTQGVPAGSDTAVAGTSGLNQAAGPGPQGIAGATFNAARIRLNNDVVAYVQGEAKGTTSVEAERDTNGFAMGYSTIASSARADSGDLGFASSTSANIRSSAFANGLDTEVVSQNDGQASSFAWDAANPAPFKMPGTESASANVVAATRAEAVTKSATDFAWGRPVTGGLPNPGINPVPNPGGRIGLTLVNPGNIVPNPNVGQVWSQVYAGAGNERNIYEQSAPVAAREAISFTYTTSLVSRNAPQGLTTDANRVGAEAFISDATSDARGQDDRQPLYSATTSLDVADQRSGGHRVSTSPAPFTPTGSTAGLVARAQYNPATVVPSPLATAPVNQVSLGYFSPTGVLNTGHITGGYSSGLRTTHSGTATFTGNRWDDAGSAFEINSQEAVSTSSAGTYGIDAGSVNVQEWIAGHQGWDNLHIVDGALPIDYTHPNVWQSLDPQVYANSGIGFGVDEYGWRGVVGGPQ